MQVLIPLFGEENIRVSVNSIVNMDRTYTDSTNYSGEEDGEGIIGDRVFEQEITGGETRRRGYGRDPFKRRSEYLCSGAAECQRG